MAIVTALVQRHRHPERHDPQQARSRPKRSRAQGLARIVLESIPIVKFDQSIEKEEDAAAHEDIELAGTDQALNQSTATDANDPSTTWGASSINPSTSPNVRVTATGGLSAIGPDLQAPSDGLGCSICLGLFISNEDIRVLPCNHKFHPVCIDPWLLNVSGTCPTW